MDDALEGGSAVRHGLRQQTVARWGKPGLVGTAVGTVTGRRGPGSLVVASRGSVRPQRPTRRPIVRHRSRPERLDGADAPRAARSQRRNRAARPAAATVACALLPVRVIGHRRPVARTRRTVVGANLAGHSAQRGGGLADGSRTPTPGDAQPPASSGPDRQVPATSSGTGRSWGCWACSSSWRAASSAARCASRKYWCSRHRLHRSG